MNRHILHVAFAAYCLAAAFKNCFRFQWYKLYCHNRPAEEPAGTGPSVLGGKHVPLMGAGEVMMDPGFNLELSSGSR